MKHQHLKSLVAAVITLGITSLPSAQAHHSFAMFDMSKKVTLTGTVRTWEWTNPHSWLWVYVTEVDGKPVADKDGNPQVWGLEGTAPGELMRAGITKDTFKKGDKITVTAAPLKDGRTGGSMGRVTFADGRVVGGAAGPQGPGGAGGPPPGGAPGGAAGGAPGQGGPGSGAAPKP